MAAGVTDRLWDVNDLVALWEQYERRAERAIALTEGIMGKTITIQLDEENAKHLESFPPGFHAYTQVSAAQCWLPDQGIRGTVRPDSEGS